MRTKNIFFSPEKCPAVKFKIRNESNFNFMFAFVVGVNTESGRRKNLLFVTNDMRDDSPHVFAVAESEA